MRKFLATILMGLCLGGTPSSATPVIISDSLVHNLSCNSLSLNTILVNIRPEAFSAKNHLPLKNWPFYSGPARIAACWGMSSTQRKLLYLLRLNEKEAPAPNSQLILDMIRGATLKTISKFGGRYLMEQPLHDYEVIPVAEANLGEEYDRNTGTSLLDTLFNGIDYELDSVAIHRDLKTEIERSQERHFYRLGNIEMGAEDGPLSPRKNKHTLQNLMANLTLNRLTLINLRLSRNVQHMVIAKSFVKDDKGNVWIRAYNSNKPDMDQEIYYSNESGHFYSPQIMGPFVGDKTGTDYTHPLGVFIVDEAERTELEIALLKHYQQRCLAAFKEKKKL
ncbi:MAG: hypothetical protein ACXVB4_07085 [Pseudobdellovibrionaceae bacterium]